MNGHRCDILSEKYGQNDPKSERGTMIFAG